MMNYILSLEILGSPTGRWPQLLFLSPRKNLRVFIYSSSNHDVLGLSLKCMLAY